MYLFIMSYICIVIGLLAIIARIIKINQTPLHVRWEIYPVAHEPGDKARYGGSYLEEPDWWEKPRGTSFINMMKVQIPEMFFLSAVREHQPSLWYRTFPFHFGLYLIMGGLFLFLLSLFPVLSWLSVIASFILLVGMISGAVGACLLLVGRLTQSKYQGYSTFSDFFNLFLFIVTFCIGIIAGFMDPGFEQLRGFLHALVTFSLTTGAIPSSPWINTEIALFSLLIAYVPLTHMSHFFVKYFTYHDIRWDDTPNLPGSEIEKKIAQVLSYRVTWSAPHIRGEGKKTWVDVATEEIES